MTQTTEQYHAADERLVEELVAPRRILRSYLLLLLDQQAGHGYELMARLEPLGYARTNPGRVYRSLRWLEDAGLVEPTWQTDVGAGPARRVYEVTPAGRHALELATPRLRRHARSAPGPQARYVQGRLRAVATGMQAFGFTVEARLSVQACDEASARRKLERAFGQARTLGTDVHATGDAAIRSGAGAVVGAGPSPTSGQWPTLAL